MVQHSGSSGKDSKLLTFLLGAVSMLILLGVIYIFTSQYRSASSSSEISGRNDIVRLETSDEESSTDEEQESSQARTVENLNPTLIGTSVSSSALDSDFTASASSTYISSKGNDYSASNILDGSIDTCWLEGASGGGEGTTLTLTSKASDTLSIKTVTVFAGYCYDNDSWSTNYLPTQMSLSLGSEQIAVLNLEMSREGQKFTFTDPVEVKPGESLVFTITKAEAGGSSAYADTGVTEISFGA